MLVPLYVPDTIGPGLDRLPPQDQVRGAWLPAVLVIAGLPNILLVAVAEREEQPAAPVYALAAVSTVLVLAMVRQLIAARETQRLYAEVARAAESRRELLAQLMQRTDEDRHRVAAQLHEQAVSAYASFVSFVQAHAGGAVGGGGVGSASVQVRGDLRDQAESLRQLMLAVRPLEVDRPRSTSLATPVRAYVDGLYRDRPPPALQVTVADDVVLDWTTETLVLRITQEAVRNVWRHSRAGRIDVEVRGDGPAVEVCVTDDGVGFAPEAVLFESGIAAMRGFAALGQGSLRIESRPGEGTRVVARLGDVPVPPATAGVGAAGDGPSPPTPAAGLRAAAGLRLVHSVASVGEA